MYTCKKLCKFHLPQVENTDTNLRNMEHWPIYRLILIILLVALVNDFMLAVLD